MKALITGGAGYIGTQLAYLLQKRGDSVRILDNLSLSSPRNLFGLTDIEFVRGDIRNKEAVERAIDGVDVVFHLAARTGADKSHEIPEKVESINTEGTKKILEVLESRGVGVSFVFVSSCNVYGDTDSSRDLVEGDSVDPRNPYAESKLKAEKLCMDSSLDSVVLRPATNFGWSPGVRFNLVVNSFVFRAVMGEPLTVYGEGSNWRPFMHVKDTAQTILESVDWPTGIYNIGWKNLQIKEISETIKEVVDKDVEIEYQLDMDSGPSYRVDFSKAKKHGLKPNFALKDGIEELIEKFESPLYRKNEPNKI